MKIITLTRSPWAVQSDLRSLIWGSSIWHVCSMPSAATPRSWRCIFQSAAFEDVPLSHQRATTLSRGLVKLKFWCTAISTHWTLDECPIRIILEVIPCLYACESIQAFWRDLCKGGPKIYLSIGTYIEEIMVPRSRAPKVLPMSREDITRRLAFSCWLNREHNMLQPKYIHIHHL